MRSRGYPSSAMKNVEEAFQTVEQFAINYSDTDAIVSQLTIRLGDWFEDPDPSYDETFAGSNQEELYKVYQALLRLRD
jgi:hypothetical protein